MFRQSDSNDQSLAPGLLIATPKLDGGPFERAVIALVYHDNDEGTVGFILNKPLDVDFGSIMEGVDESFQFEMSDTLSKRMVSFGGPVQMQQLWVIYQRLETDPEPSALSAGPETMTQLFEEQREPDLDFHENWALTASSDKIESLAVTNKPRAVLPMLGYTGWGAGQLQGELEEGSWLTVGFDGSFLEASSPEGEWDRAMDSLGLTGGQFMMMGDGGSA